ncbi:hypothetical protein [Coralliovum pocilloporae]|uniref:hypothetical protein n=1 Tax=Coralliovum pocilloporae TaxID=3066369 RepID=UPI00330706F9
MTLFKTILTTTALATTFMAAVIAPTQADQSVRRTLFVVDTSGSSTFLVEQYFADQAADYVHGYILGLKPPHDLRMISVGNEGFHKSPINVRGKVTKRRASSPKRVAPQFAGYFRSLPTLAKQGVVQADGMTSLTAFFESLEPICSSAPSRVIVFSDGVQWDSQIDGRQFIAGKVKLSKPIGTPLTGCHVEMLGVGQLKISQASDGLAARLIPQWKVWLEEAGATSVRVVGKLFAF